jgi:DNA-binding CsgD family transcriptional regulator
MPGGVIGRERELAAVSGFLEGHGPPSALLIGGEAGIGKTTLWRAGIEEAERVGFRVLACSGAESETQLSFAALRDLLDPTFDEIANQLPGPQRRALAVTLLREEPPARPLDLGAIGVAFLGALTLLAAHARVLVAVDDIQWLERTSAAVLAYALRRHDHAPFAVLLARRSEHADELALDRLEPGRLELIELGALSVGALGRILHERLGVAYPRPTLHRLADASGGNPFFALELARALGDHAHSLAPGEPLPVPPTLRELVTTRLAALPEATLDVLTYAAASSRPTLATVGSAAGVDLVPPLDPAIAAHVVDVRASTIHFAHPLFAAGVYGLAGPSRRREVHVRLAAVVDDAEERARHLALATEVPDEEVASVLEGSARRTRIRGDRVVSAQLFQDAARLTPEQDISRRARRMLAGAGALFEAGDSDTARELLEQVVEAPGEPDAAAEARWRLGTVLAETGSGDRAMQLWQEALESTRDPSRAAEIQRSMAVSTLYAGNADAAVEYAKGALASAEASAEPEPVAFALSTRALTAAVAGDPAYRSFVGRALELESTLDIASSAWSPSAVAGECALLTLDLEQAGSRFSAVLAQAVEAGNVEMELWGAHRLATARLAAGDARSALELAELVVDLAETTGVMRLPAARLSAEIDAHFGNPEQARDRLETVAGEARREGWNRHLWLTQCALGALHLARADLVAAADELLAARRLATENGMRNAAVLVPLADEVEAAVGAGRTEEAEEALATMRGFREVPSWAESILLRAEAALLAAHGELGEAETALDRATAEQAVWAVPLQRARTLLALGDVQRRARRRRAARDTLQQALALFEELGAPLWAERARTELARIGGRAPSGHDLTPAERRVAELVAQGKTNKEVAAELVVSVHTVESALTQVYRKLEVRSRTELARKLAAPA